MTVPYFCHLQFYSGIKLYPSCSKTVRVVSAKSDRVSPGRSASIAKPFAINACAQADASTSARWIAAIRFALGFGVPSYA